MSTNERIGPHEVHPIASTYPLMPEAQLEELAEDIRQNGLREPVLRLWVTDDAGIGTPLILDGRNRLTACEMAGVVPTFADYDGPADLDALLSLVRSKNLARRHLTESQRALVAARSLHLYEEAARERQKAAAGATNASRWGNSIALGSSAQSDGRARDIAARDHGVSGRLVRQKPERQLELLESARGSDGRVRAGTMRSLIRRAERDELARVLEGEAPPPPEGPYRVIAVDFPWPYEARTDDATHRGAIPYPSMSIDEGRAMPVGDLAHDDCVLWMWTTNAFMGEAYELLDAWGFEPKTILTWDKEKLGLGSYLRNRTEHCILAVRGRPTLQLSAQSTVIREPPREHSRKPEAFYELVADLCPGAKVELFAREPRPGWARWGAESEKFA